MPNTVKYHHLVPKNYLDPWGEQHTVHCEEDGQTQPRATATLLDLHYYHSITAGSPLATEADTNILFEEMKGLQAFYREDVLSSTLAMNQEFEFFEDWVLQRRDGSSAKKKPVKHVISQARIDTEEESWEEELEKQWTCGMEKLRSMLEGGEEKPLSQEDLAFFLGLSWVMDWNTWVKQPVFQEILQLLPFLKKIQLPRHGRQFPYVTCHDDELVQWLLTSQVRQFLQKEGAIWHCALQALDGLSFQFITNEVPLSTGNKPSFSLDKMGYFALNPNILLVIRPSLSGSSTFEEGSQEDWAEFQQIILKEQSEWIIHPHRKNPEK